MSSDHYEIKLKSIRKSPNMWKLNIIHINNMWGK